MNSINSIAQHLKTGNTKTVTVDVFDTILLRKIWPEGRQFLEAAKRALPLFKKYISPEITPYEIYTWREFTRQELLDAKRKDFYAHNDVDINLEEWFNALFTLLTAKYTGETKKAPKEFIEQLVHVEMELEKEYLQPNHRLVSTLRQTKAETPGLKVYFLSDMYLTTQQVEELLSHHGILDLFDGGTTSTDTGNAKSSGRLFYLVHSDNKQFADINLSYNLHIGDNKHSDFHMPKSIGSEAILYHSTRARRLRTLAGRAQLKSIKNSNRKAESNRYNRAIKKAYRRNNTSARYFHDLGFLFSQPMAAYLLHVGFMSQLASDKHFLFVSSEASTFINAGKKLFGTLYNAPESATKLNRKRTISAVAWTLIQKNEEKLMPQIVRVIRYGEVSENRKDLYDFILTTDYPVNEAYINSLSRHDFYKKLHEDIQAADKKYTAHLKEDFDYVKFTLPADGKSVVICDVGWGATVQAVYTIFAELQNYPGEIEGLYLGTHPPTRFKIAPIPVTGYLLKNVLSRKERPYWSAVIWEYVYTNKFQFDGDEARLKHVGEGLDNGYDYFRHIHLSPTEHFDYVIKPRIKRLLRHPTDAEVRHLGEIRYDFGFNNPQILRIVDTDYPRWKFAVKMFIKPKAALGQIVAPNNWTGGYIKRFKLIGAPTLLKILGRLKHTNYL